MIWRGFTNPGTLNPPPPRESITSQGAGADRVKIGSGSWTTNLEFFEEELNTGVGWGWGQIKVGVGNSFPTTDKGWG